MAGSDRVRAERAGTQLLRQRWDRSRESAPTCNRVTSRVGEDQGRRRAKLGRPAYLKPDRPAPLPPRFVETQSPFESVLSSSRSCLHTLDWVTSQIPDKRPASLASAETEGAPDKAKMIVGIRTKFAGLAPVFEHCDCQEDPSPIRRLHVEAQDTEGEAWEQLLALIDEAADDGREDFTPGAELPRALWSQIVTLPRSIAKLTKVKRLNLYGSNLIAIPPEIGEMRCLEGFRPYTSRRLHWFPFEITRCTALRDSIVSTRNIYGNYKYRTPFPQLPAVLPSGSTPASCSVCDGPLPSSNVVQVWISLWVATDVLPLLVHSCSQECFRALPKPPDRYVTVPHVGGQWLVQPLGSLGRVVSPKQDRHARSASGKSTDPASAVHRSAERRP